MPRPAPPEAVELPWLMVLPWAFQDRSSQPERRDTGIAHDAHAAEQDGAVVVNEERQRPAADALTRRELPAARQEPRLSVGCDRLGEAGTAQIDGSTDRSTKTESYVIGGPRLDVRSYRPLPKSSLRSSAVPVRALPDLITRRPCHDGGREEARHRDPVQ